MGRLKVLVVEDVARWQKELKEILRGLEPDGTEVEIAGDHPRAHRKLASESYDLAVIDLSLLGAPTDAEDADEMGMDLLEGMRGGSLNRHCAVLICTARATTEVFHRALKTLGVEQVIPKQDFVDLEDEEFLRVARRGLLLARLRKAAARHAERYHLVVTFNGVGWSACELRGPDVSAWHVARHPVPFEREQLARRADRLNRFLREESLYETWNEEVRDVGKALYESVETVPRIHRMLAAAEALAGRHDDLWLRFRGPVSELALPCDLLHDDQDHACLRRVVSREMESVGFSRHVLPFFRVVGSLFDEGRPLRVLLVAANSDGKLPAVDYECEKLAREIRADLEVLGLPVDEPRVIPSSDATYDRVREELRSGRYHIFHYAGHGRYDSRQPEVGGLILRDGAGTRVLTADELGLAQESQLQLVFLSCCLGARGAGHVERGALHGMFEALAKADVPTVVGHRWVVQDEASILFASTFYAHLWRSFSPGEAMLAARKECAGRLGRRNPVWASPILMTRGW